MRILASHTRSEAQALGHRAGGRRLRDRPSRRWRMSKFIDANQVVEYGTYDGDGRGFLLSPTSSAVPEPATLAPATLGALLLVVRRLRRRG